MQYKKILVPLDGSKLAESALPYAAELASRLNLDMILVNVCHTGSPEAFPACTDYLTAKAAEIEQQVNENRASAGSTGGKTRVQPLIKDGYPAEEIIRSARDNATDLIVMASHGASGLRGWFIGSVADKVLRRSDVPVFLVGAGMPSRADYHAWLRKTVLVPLDGSTMAEAVLPHVEALARQPAGESPDIRLLRIVEMLWDSNDYPEAGIAVDWDKLEQARSRIRQSANDYVAGIESRLREKGIKASSETRMSPVAEGIAECATEYDADLIVMATHGLSGGDRWELGSNANKVLRSVSCPVLMVRP